MPRLFFKELKANLRSIIFIAFVGAILGMYLFNAGGLVREDVNGYEEYVASGYDPAKYEPYNPLMKPPEGLDKSSTDSYGFERTKDPAVIMPIGIEEFKEEYKNNSYFALSLTENGEYLSEPITLDDAKQAQMGEIIAEMETLTPAEYDQFKQLADEAHHLLIDTTNSVKTTFSDYTSEYGVAIPKTYEQALAEYNAFVEDGISNSYARLFCDYVGITVALWSIFVVVSISLRDRRTKVNESIFTRKISSAKLILSRFFSQVLLILLPIIAVGLVLSIQLRVFSMQYDAAIAPLAFAHYITTWILPTVLFVVSIGMLITILTDTAIAIPLMVVFGFVSVSRGVHHDLVGVYNFELTIRHNSMTDIAIYQGDIQQLIINRVFYTAISIILIVATIIIYEQKRKGKIDVGGQIKKLFRRGKSSTKAIATK